MDRQRRLIPLLVLVLLVAGMLIAPWGYGQLLKTRAGVPVVDTTSTATSARTSATPARTSTPETTTAVPPTASTAVGTASATEMATPIVTVLPRIAAPTAQTVPASTHRRGVMRPITSTPVAVTSIGTVTFIPQPTHHGQHVVVPHATIVTPHPVAMTPDVCPGADPSGGMASCPCAWPLQVRMVEWAKSQLGKPYLLGASGPDSYDSAGLTHAIYASVGIEIGNTTNKQAVRGITISANEIQPGDLIFYETMKYVGMYLGNGQMIHVDSYGVAIIAWQIVPVTKIIRICNGP